MLIFSLRNAFVQTLSTEGDSGAGGRRIIADYDQVLKGRAATSKQAGDIAQVDLDRLEFASASCIMMTDWQPRRESADGEDTVADRYLKTAPPIEQFDVAGPFDFSIISLPLRASQLRSMRDRYLKAAVAGGGKGNNR